MILMQELSWIILFFKATDLGLGTCFMGAFKKYAAQKLLDLDKEYEPVLFTPLGYSMMIVETHLKNPLKN